MGYINQKMKEVFTNFPPLRFLDFNSDSPALPYVIVVDCTATDASSFTYELDEDVRVVDAWFVAVAANGSATAQVTDADDNAITDAAAIASDKALARAGEINDANWDESAGNNLKVAQNGNGDSCWAFIVVIPKKS